MGALHALVLELFTGEEFRRWLRHGPDAELVAESPGESASDAAVVDGALRALQRRGRIDAQFFARMASVRERRRDAIEVVAARWSVPSSSPVVDDVTAPTDFFTGREQELAAIHEAFTREGGPGMRIHALSGMPGSGKTQTALEYVRRHRDAYERVFQIRGDSAASIDSGFERIARALALVPAGSIDQQVAITKANAWLDGHTGWLLLVDNLDAPELLARFRPRSGRGHILVTSRAQVFHRLGSVTVTWLDQLALSDAVVFLLRRTEHEDSDDAERTAAAELAEALGRLALALEQAAAYIAENQTRLDTYLAQYRRRGLELLESMPPVAGDYPHSVRTVLSMTFPPLCERLPASADLLSLSAFLHPDAIPFELVVEGGDALGESIGQVLGQDPSELDVSRLIAPLARQSLVRPQPATRSYSIHRLVQEVVRAGLSGEARRLWSVRAVQAVTRVLPDARDVAGWSACERLHPHAVICAERIRAGEVDISEASTLIDWLGVYTKERARYAEAEPFLRLALALRERALGPDHALVADVVHNLGELMWHVERFDEAETFYRRAQSIREREPVEARRLATTLSYRGYLCYSLGRHDEAERLHLRALELRRGFGENDPDLATTLNNLGRLYLRLGKYAESEASFVEALRIRVTTLPPNHFHIGYTLNGLGNLCRTLRRWADAESLYRRAVQITEAALGKDDPRIARILDGWALLCQEQHQHAEAEQLFARAIAIVRASRGEGSRDLPRLLEGHAVTLSALGRADAPPSQPDP